MLMQQELKKELINKLNKAISINLPYRQNGTITKDELLDISNGITKYLNKTSNKPEIVQQICNQLEIPPNDEHIGDRGQISAKFIEDIIEFLPED